MDTIKHLDQMRAPRAGRRSCLLVLGMHRSGTSALTRVLSIAGAQLPADLMGATAANESGHWESNRLFAYHDQMLSEFASTWDDWRAIDFSRVTQRRRDDIAGDISEILTVEFGDAPIIVVKDPRICRFATLFFTALQRAGYDHRCILAFRSPLEVVQSLAARDGMPRTRAALLWLRHVLEAEAATRHSPRMFLNYGHLLSDWKSAFASLEKRLSLVLPNQIPDIEEQVNTFLSPQLRNYTSSTEEVLLDPLLRGWISDVYSALLLLEQNESAAEALQTFDRVKGEFDAATPMMAQALIEDAKLLAEMRSRTDQVQAQLVESLRVRDALVLDVQSRDAELKLVGDQRVALVADVASGKGLIESLTAELDAKRQAHAHVEQIANDLRTALTDSELKLDQARSEIARTGAELNSANLEVETLRRSQNELESSLDVANAEIENLNPPIFRNTVVRPTVSWLLGDADSELGIERERLVDWLVPSLQNYADGEAWRVNANGAELAELVKLLDQKPDTMISRPEAMRKTASLLLVSEYAPSFSHAGGLRVRDLYAEIKQLAPHVRMDLYCPSAPAIDGDIGWLSDIFDNVFLTKPEEFSFIDFVRKAGRDFKYDVVDLQFHRAGRLVGQFRDVAYRTLFTPMECLSRSLFEKTRSDLRHSRSLLIGDLISLARCTIDEMRIVSNVDETVCVSDADADFLKKLASRKPIEALATGLSEFEFGDQLASAYRPKPPSAKARRLVYAAYFGSDTNRVGLTWFLDHVHPHIVRACPDYKLSVVGRGDLSAFIERKPENVTFVGEVPVMPPVLEQARAGLVLALHGSGFRGKINQYAICGLPSISTNLGVTGLAYTPGEDILTADDPHEFALACIRLLQDDAYLDALALKARATALKNYRWSESHAKIREIYGL